jgi:hypothetical protein
MGTVKNRPAVFKNQYRRWIESRHPSEIAVIIAIAQKDRARDHRKKHRFGNNTCRYMHEGCEMVFAGHRIMRDGLIDTTDANSITLDVRL